MSLVNVVNANFNGNDLAANVPGLTVLATNPYNPAKRGLTIQDLARTNKAKINSGFYNKRTLLVKCGITRPTRDLAEQSFDTLMGLLQLREKALLLQQSGGLRQFTASYSDTTFSVEGGSYLEFTLVFETSDHYGYDLNSTLLNQITNFTSANKTDQISVGGSAEWQSPITVITFSALTGGTSATVRVGNDATGQIITVTRTFAPGDVLTIDSLNQSVQVNGAEVSFTGAFPEWNIGVGYVSYSDTLTTRTFSSTMTYKKRYV